MVFKTLGACRVRDVLDHIHPKLSAEHHGGAGNTARCAQWGGRESREILNEQCLGQTPMGVAFAIFIKHRKPKEIGTRSVLPWGCTDAHPCDSLAQVEKWVRNRGFSFPIFAKDSRSQKSFPRPEWGQDTKSTLCKLANPPKEEFRWSLAKRWLAKGSSFWP